ncbi:hypothetical protein ACW9YV_23715 (plasmid) [Paraburkholderia strydomiana]
MENYNDAGSRQKTKSTRVAWARHCPAHAPRRRQENSPDFPRRRDAHIIEAFADNTSDKGAVRRPFAIT